MASAGPEIPSEEEVQEARDLGDGVDRKGKFSRGTPGRQNNLPKTQSLGFPNPLSGTTDRPNLTHQTNLAKDGHIRRHGAIGG